jgi:hypothetical protein
MSIRKKKCYSKIRCSIDSTTYFSYQDINGSLSYIRVSTTLLHFDGYMLKRRKVKWWLNVDT